MLSTTACEDEALNPYIEPLPGVHAYAVMAEGSPEDFAYGNTEEDVSFDIQWVSVDNALTVNRIDLFVLFNENYTDQDGNPLVARHGGDEGILFRTIEGSELPVNRTNVGFSLDQAEIYQLYEGITYDYDDDESTPETPVFANPAKPARVIPGAPFVESDNFVVRWVLYTDDDQVFDSWSPSVCTELPGANCDVTWGVEFLNPVATYFTLVPDSEGDVVLGGDTLARGEVGGIVLNEGGTQNVYVTFDRALQTPPTFAVSTADGGAVSATETVTFTEAGSEVTAYRTTLTGGNLADAEVTIDVSGAVGTPEVGGQTMMDNSFSVIVDNTIPTYNLSYSAPATDTGFVVTVTATFSEDVQAPTISISGQGITSVEGASMELIDEQTATYEFEPEAEGEVTEGPLVITVSATDLAGNAAEAEPDNPALEISRP